MTDRPFHLSLHLSPTKSRLLCPLGQEAPKPIAFAITAPKILLQRPFLKLAQKLPMDTSVAAMPARDKEPVQICRLELPLPFCAFKCLTYQALDFRITPTWAELRRAMHRLANPVLCRRRRKRMFVFIQNRWQILILLARQQMIFCCCVRRSTRRRT